MSIAILIKGFPYLNSETCINYKNVSLNYNEYIVKTLELLNITNNAEIFIHTYNLKISDILKKFNPTEFVVGNISDGITYEKYLQYNIYSLLSVISIYLKHIDQYNKQHDKIFIFDMFDKMEIDKNKLEFGFSFNGNLIYGNSVTKLNHPWYITFDKLINSITSIENNKFFYKIHKDYLNIIEQFAQQQKRIIVNFEYKHDNCKKLFDICSYWNDQIKEYKVNGVYKIYNVKNKKYIFIDNLSHTGIDSIKFDTNKSTPFYIYSPGEKYHIRIQELLLNQNNTKGWHIFGHEDGKVYGAGNNGSWSLFDILTKDNNILIKSVHTRKNILGGDGMYLCINNDNIVFCNGDQKMYESQWKLIPHEIPIKELAVCQICKIQNVKTELYLYANDISPKNTTSIIPNTISTYFYIYTNDNKNYCIRLNENILNQNGTLGWHLYILPNNDKLYSAGNVSLLSSFNIIQKDVYYLIKSAYSNKYLYIDGNLNIKIDGSSESVECLWKFIL